MRQQEMGFGAEWGRRGVGAEVIYEMASFLTINATLFLKMRLVIFFKRAKLLIG